MNEWGSLLLLFVSLVASAALGGLAVAFTIEQMKVAVGETATMLFTATGLVYVVWICWRWLKTYG